MLERDPPATSSHRPLFWSGFPRPRTLPDWVGKPSLFYCIVLVLLPPFLFLMAPPCPSCPVTDTQATPHSVVKWSPSEWNADNNVTG